MFSLVPFALGARPPTPTGEVTLGDVTGSSKLLVPGRVTSATGIPQGAMSVPITARELRGQPDVMQVSVGVDKYGTIELKNSSRDSWPDSIHWIRAVRLSDDCHSCNMQLRCVSSTKQTTEATLAVQCVRPVSVGQELLLWFSEDVLAMLQMVFLTPANIQGQKKYVCTRCSALYESPNPLKLHITLGCGRHTISWMWDKLSGIVGESSQIARHEFNFGLGASAQQRSAIDLTTSSKLRVGHNSAFRPFEKPNNNNNNTLSAQFYQQWPPTLAGFRSGAHAQMMRGYEGDEAQIETLVSSLGKSKQGHVCLYCGKCYSRKYGLKIHIRTHTGYKPLKCKFCLRPFGDPSNLNKHVRLHAAGDTPYKCDLCGKVLVRRRDLERHLKSRHMSDIHPENTTI